MKLSNLLLGSALASAVPSLAHPGSKWKETMVEIEAEIQRRAARPANGPDDSSELLGDLVKPGPSTQVGKDIAGILVGKVDAQSDEQIRGKVAQLGSDACKKDTCCVWKYIADEMLQKFKGRSSKCNKFARGAVRLGFHDAGTWKKGNDFGGADGSVILTNEISARPVNRGLEEITAVTKQWYDKYKQYGITAADLVQMGANVATVACPLGPRVRTYVGRKDNARLPPDNLLPEPTDPADKLIKLFEDKTIKPHGLAALVGAHTTSQQRFFKPRRALDPQDSTPGVWDVLFYGQTLNSQAPRRILKFPSDVSLSVHPRVKDEWREFAGPGGQEHWNEDYAKEYVRLSLLGVNNINSLQECTKVLPPTSGGFDFPNQDVIDKWLNGGFGKSGQKVGEALADALPVDNSTLQSIGVDPKDATTPANIEAVKREARYITNLPTEGL
ncbi:peroxidase [Tothia fuscella]|uniref:Peroxidase n=1 Tax=Tothia fuscella TaxID=1048955 RepID=A0A9P4NPK2_9PEZI|nr:peroxidase [Tothia fuscella]